MIKKFCDRCEKEIDVGKYEEGEGSISIQVLNKEIWEDNTYITCSKCTKELEDFMNGKMLR